MIPSSQFIHVIQAERELDLQRWQLARSGALSERPRPTTSLGGRLRTALGSLRLAGRPEVAHASGAERTSSIVACC